MARPPRRFEQILQLVKAKLPEAVILKKISDSPGLNPSPEQLVQLKTAGASDNILLAISGARPAKPEPAKEPASGSDTFTARGLTNEEILTKMHQGDFAGLSLTNEDLKFTSLFGQYLENYARRCAAFLPADKVQLRGVRCSAVYTRTGQCADWESYDLPGLFAKPELHDARAALARQTAADAGRRMSVMLGNMAGKGKTPMEALPQMVADGVALASDMEKLVRTNRCDGAGLKRFEENLRLFALGKQPIRLGAESAAPVRPKLNQNYTKLLSGLVSEDATRWGMAARLVRGSVSEASVTAKDDAGSPAKVAASYVWEGMLGRKRGGVTLTFSEGMPECLYYSETPTVCHTPGRKIAAAFAAGSYEQ